MVFFFRRFQNLDGWDALLLLAGLLVGSIGMVVVEEHATAHLTATLGGAGTLAAAVLPVLLRHIFWPPAPSEPSRHNVGTLLLVGVGGFVSVLGLLLGALFTSFVVDTTPAHETPAAILALPAVVVAMGVSLVLIGLRLARRRSGASAGTTACATP